MHGAGCPCTISSSGERGRGRGRGGGSVNGGRRREIGRGGWAYSANPMGCACRDRSLRWSVRRWSGRCTCGTGSASPTHRRSDGIWIRGEAADLQRSFMVLFLGGVRTRTRIKKLSRPPSLSSSSSSRLPRRCCGRPRFPLPALGNVELRRSLKLWANQRSLWFIGMRGRR